jgi:signal transduction histidine kinase
MNVSGSLLIVDDEAALVAALTNSLRPYAYEVLGVSSVAEALAALRSRRFDLLLVDLKMPEMSGITLLREAQLIDPQLAGIVMTGHGTIATAVEAMQVGALDYIRKPFKLSEVLAAVARALTVRRLHLENVALERRIRERSIELEAANRELDAFAYSVAHDLRTPLAAIKVTVDILAGRHGPSLAPEVRRLVDQIEEAADEGDRLVRDLLRFFRAGRQALSKVPVDVAALVADVIETARSQEPERRVDLRVEQLPQVVRADRSLLHQVFTNLVSNAFKFTRPREHATVTIGCAERDGEQVFFIRDNGVGFDMRNAATLFGVFQRLHPSAQFEGSGVGLSIVQRIVHRHGGRIWAEAEPDRGATFFFTLGPAAASAEASDRPSGD